MLRESSFLIRAKVIIDLLLLSAILLFLQSGLTNLTGSLSSTQTILSIGLCTLSWLFIGRAIGLYVDMRVKPFSIEWVIFLKTFFFYCLLTSFIFFQLFNLSSPEHRKDFLLHCLLVFLLFPLQKLAVRVVFKRIKNSDNIRRKVLIIGAGETGLDFFHQYVKNKHYGYQLAGFLDDAGQPALNGHYLGKTSELEKVIAKHDLDDIVVALPVTSQNQIHKIISIGEQQGKRVRIIPDYRQYGDGKMHVDKVGNLSIITLRSLPLDIVDNKILKRTFDVIFSLAVIVCLFSWLFPIIALIIKLTSKGPVFFKQARWGLNNKTIICWKFRSMKPNSTDVDEKGNYQQARKDDPRVTKIGKFLRKTNLDELPQFFNVLIGSMSVVGPRPHPVPLNEASKDSVEKYMMRHWVKPGITGWAQIHGYRGETRDPMLMKKRVQHDVWYIENWTFWLDQQIIVQTLVNTIKGEKNAY
jgi:putative colanic acid biosynthesis UDP-glucose lipid carrier transferase